VSGEGTLIIEPLDDSDPEPCGAPCCQTPLTNRRRVTILLGDTANGGFVRCARHLEGTPTPFALAEVEVPKKKPRGLSRARKLRSVRQEIELAEGLGGHVQRASGAMAGHKGDARVVGRYRMEAKSTDAASFTITRTVLDKIRSECGLNEAPVLDILFLTPRTLAEADRWVAIPYPLFQELDSAALPGTSRPRR